jgi:sirohydrochlorin cobaltochelatase
VTVVAPAVAAPIARAAKAGRVRWLKRRFAARHVAGARLVVMATDDPAVNAAGVRAARAGRALVCDASSADSTEVIFGALLRRGRATIAAFSDGADPSLSRATRDRIASLIPDGRAARRRSGAGMSSLLVLVAHGSRDPRWGLPLEALAESVRADAGDCAVRIAYSQFASPGLAEVVAQAAASGIRRVRILPLFTTRNGHVERDVQPQAQALRAAHADVAFEFLPPIGEHPSFRRLLVEIAKEGR